MTASAVADPRLSERVLVRFAATFAGNVLRAGISFLNSMVVARGLGAFGFGELNFLLGSFAAVNNLLDMGTSAAFYTFLSRRRRPTRFFLLYLGWMGAQFLGTVLVVGLLFPKGLVERVWIGHERGIVLLAFGASFLTTRWWGLLSQLGEASKRTVAVQAASVLRATLHLVLVSAAVYWARLKVQTVFSFWIAEYLLLTLVAFRSLLRNNVEKQPATDCSFRVLAAEFVTYCKPLLLYGWMSFLYLFADRWMLQRFGGSSQQGFLAVGQQFASIGLITAGSILNVFWKEAAEAQYRNNDRRVRMLYSSLARALYFAAAWLGCLLIPYSRNILVRILGAGYEPGWLALALMFLFPMHQCLGQIQGTFLYASGATAAYARIGLFTMGISIPVTYFLLAPRSMPVPGLGLGAAGLAVKMVVLQWVGVNLQAYTIARRNGWKFEYGYQIVTPAILLSLALLCKALAGGSPLPGGLLYIALSSLLLYRTPLVVGFPREGLPEVTDRLMSILRSCRATEASSIS
ncbi:MAG: lipopolysaccharide biosynthesis protein [Acidobacteria bacterium]|nr:lipopolysaccharide biosynthesis protein [Acidobacteriota bacterium]